MKSLIFATTLCFVIAMAVPGAVAEPNPAQSGENSDCMDYNILYEVPGVHSPFAAFIDVEAGTNFTASASTGVIVIDFYDEDGVSVGYSIGKDGSVPSNAAYGTICASTAGGYPEVGVPGSTWTYQDGF